jgi:hypothetical protein
MGQQRGGEEDEKNDDWSRSSYPKHNNHHTNNNISYKGKGPKYDRKNNHHRLPPQQQQKQQPSLLPYLMIHIGPQKTMSSGMQCVLQDLQTILLEKDGIAFVGKVDARACSKNSLAVSIDDALEDVFWHDDACVDQLLEIHRHNRQQRRHKYNNYKNDTVVSLTTVQCWDNFLMALDKLNDKNIILSDEKLSEVQFLWWGVNKTKQFWRFLQEQLQDRYRIRIVMVYRRWYEWLASIKNQADKYSLGRPGMKQWPPMGPEKEPIFPHLMRWMRNASEIPSPYTPELYNVFANELRMDVSLLNMHDTTRDLLEDFLCDSIVGADHACQEYRQAQMMNSSSSSSSSNRTKYKYTSNPSENPFCDQIAYKAYQQGIIRDLRGHRKGADRIFFNEVIHRRLAKLNMTPYDLPLSCPTHQELRPLLDRSLQYEREFLPDFFASASMGRPVVETQFWKDVDQLKFCSVNTSAILEQKDWVTFLQQQWRPKRGKKPADWDYTTYKITNKNFTSK